MSEVVCSVLLSREQASATSRQVKQEEAGYDDFVQDIYFHFVPCLILQKAGSGLLLSSGENLGRKTENAQGSKSSGSELSSNLLQSLLTTIIHKAKPE